MLRLTGKIIMPSGTAKKYIFKNGKWNDEFGKFKPNEFVTLENGEVVVHVYTSAGNPRQSIFETDYKFLENKTIYFKCVEMHDDTSDRNQNINMFRTVGKSQYSASMSNRNNTFVAVANMYKDNPFKFIFDCSYVGHFYIHIKEIWLEEVRA